MRAVSGGRWLLLLALAAGLIGMHHLEAGSPSGHVMTAEHPTTADPVVAAGAAPSMATDMDMDMAMHMCLAVLAAMGLLGLLVLAAGVCTRRAPAASVGGIAMLAAALLVAGCGSAASHDDADVAFVTGMIPHHTQAVAMSALAADRAASPQVKALATQISGAQEPEIAQMQDLLSSWGLPSAPTAMSMPMDGMLSDGELQQLTASSGAAFDRLFLQDMTRHHTGAVDMAGLELRDGSSADAKALAQKIIDAQRAEITTMAGLLSTV